MSDLEEEEEEEGYESVATIDDEEEGGGGEDDDIYDGDDGGYDDDDIYGGGDDHDEYGGGYGGGYTNDEDDELKENTTMTTTEREKSNELDQDELDEKHTLEISNTFQTATDLYQDGKEEWIQALTYYTKAIELEEEYFQTDERKQDIDSDDLPCTFKALTCICDMLISDPKATTESEEKTELKTIWWPKILTLCGQNKDWIGTDDMERMIKRTVKRVDLIVNYYGKETADWMIRSLVDALPDDPSRFMFVAWLAYRRILQENESTGPELDELMSLMRKSAVVTEEGKITNSSRYKYTLITLSAMLSFEKGNALALRKMFKEACEPRYTREAILDKRDKGYMNLVMGKEQLRSGNLNDAENAFGYAVSAFSSNNMMTEMKRALRLYVLTNLISGSDVNPFDHPNIVPLLSSKNHRDVSNLRKARRALRENDIETYRTYVVKETGMFEDNFSRQFQSKPMASYHRRAVVELCEPFECVSLEFLASELGTTVENACELTATLVLDGELQGKLDRINLTFSRTTLGKRSSSLYESMRAWDEGLTRLRRSIVTELDRIEFNTDDERYRMGSGMMTAILGGDAYDDYSLMGNMRSQLMASRMLQQAWGGRQGYY